MKTYAFDVILDGLAEITDDQADALYAAGCDDGSPVSCNGQAWIHFDRESASLEEAIGSAIQQVQSAGLRAASIQVGVNDVSIVGAPNG